MVKRADNEESLTQMKSARGKASEEFLKSDSYDKQKLETRSRQDPGTQVTVENGDDSIERGENLETRPGSGNRKIIQLSTREKSIAAERSVSKSHDRPKKLS